MILEQGTKEWLDWRRKGIGASESAVIMGESPYLTPYQLWLEKTRGITEDTESQSGLFRKGHEFEAQVRASYEFETGLDFPPAVMEHPIYSFIKASLDGWNEETKQGIEVKYVGRAKYDEPIPRHHYIQVQHQMFVAGVDSWVYIRTCDQGNYKKETILADAETQQAIVKACVEFWHMVESGVMPAYTDRDWVPCETDDMKQALEALEQAKGKAMTDACREAVFNMATAARVTCRGWKIARDLRRITKPKVSA